MTLDVEAPEPPDITNRGVPTELDVEEIGSEVDLRRAELEELLRDGAWAEGFDEWAAYTDLSEAEFRVARDRGLFREFDFYWDPANGTIRFETPAIPAAAAAALPDPDAAESVEGELGDLGHTVVEVLEDGYVHWDEEGEEWDYVWREETFGHITPGEE